MPKPFVASAAEGFDLGTERAMRLLLRNAPPDVLARAGAHLGAITAPALVVWGERDRWIPARFGSGYAAALGDATLELVPDAGHWPWIDRPEVGDADRRVPGAALSPDPPIRSVGALKSGTAGRAAGVAVGGSARWWCWTAIVG